MAVYIKDEQKECTIDHEKIESQIINILMSLKCDKKELSILFTDDKLIRELNKQYRGQDQSTDVLSFPQNENNQEELDFHLLGDVVISTTTARKQSVQHALSLDEELILLLIHGILHLLGYDHEHSDEESRHMIDKTRELFYQVFPSKKLAKSCDL